LQVMASHTPQCIYFYFQKCAVHSQPRMHALRKFNIKINVMFNILSCMECHIHVYSLELCRAQPSACCMALAMQIKANLHVSHNIALKDHACDIDYHQRHGVGSHSQRLQWRVSQSDSFSWVADL
jgi:hypothetical protein